MKSTDTESKIMGQGQPQNQLAKGTKTRRKDVRTVNLGEAFTGGETEAEVFRRRCCL